MSDGTLTVILLPGMDGTGRLFESFLASIPKHWNPVVVRFPSDRPLGYADLFPLVEAELPAEGPFVLLAESFSGPLAVQIAARGNSRLAAVVLVASFVRSPVGPWLSALRRLAGSWCFHWPPPEWAVRRWLAGDDAPRELVMTLLEAVRAVAPVVMSRRVCEVLAVDVRDALARIRVPVLALIGACDRLVPLRNAADLWPLGDLLETESLDAPHLILQRQPAPAARAIEEFLNRRIRSISDLQMGAPQQPPPGERGA